MPYSSTFNTRARFEIASSYMNNSEGLAAQRSCKEALRMGKSSTCKMEKHNGIGIDSFGMTRPLKDILIVGPIPSSRNGFLAMTSLQRHMNRG